MFLSMLGMSMLKVMQFIDHVCKKLKMKQKFFNHMTMCTKFKNLIANFQGAQILGFVYISKDLEPLPRLDYAPLLSSSILMIIVLQHPHWAT
jgi:hypothetical protein